jgi:hypothetical protein
VPRQNEPGAKAMITLIFTNGQEIKTRCTKAASAISKAIQISPVKGSVDGTKMAKGGEVFGVIKGCGWVAA